LTEKVKRAGGSTVCLTSVVKMPNSAIMPRKPVVRERVSLCQAWTELSRLVDRAATAVLART